MLRRSARPEALYLYQLQGNNLRSVCLLPAMLWDVLLNRMALKGLSWCIQLSFSCPTVPFHGAPIQKPG